MPTYLSTFGNAQTGYRTPGDVWNQSDTVLVPGDGANGWFGVVFDFRQFVIGSGTGLRVEPGNVRKLDLKLTHTGFVGLQSGTLEIYFVDLSPFNLYTNDLFFGSKVFLPGQYLDIFAGLAVADFKAENLLTSTSFITSAGGGAQSFTFPVLPDFSVQTLTAPQEKLRAALLRSNWRNPRHTGGPPGQPHFLGLSIRLVGGTGDVQFASSRSTSVNNRPQLVSTETAFHTGHDLGTPRRGRARHCPRGGHPIGTTDLVEDGWIEGLRVDPDWWEPEDKANDYDLPESEGEITDEANF